MVVETIRAVADYLADGTYGVNAQFTSMSYDGSDVKPSSVVSIWDETRNDNVAQGRHPYVSTDLPALLITLDGDVELRGDVVSDQRDADVDVLIRYMHKDVDTADANRDAYYTLRAVEKSMRDFNSNAGGSTNRVRGDIQIIECLRMTHTRLNENIADAHVTCGLRLTFKVRDTAP